jgi:chromate reductase, NAD(P)H dehydrogenase (quinone)
MITIVSGTNRVGSNSKKVALQYQSMVKELGFEAHVLDLEWLQQTSRTTEFIKIEQEILIPAQKFIFVVPEYNGGVPGILKLLIDISDIKSAWYGKSALLCGIAAGRAGNLRGLDHLTNMLNYIKMHVWYNKIPISGIGNELDANGNFSNPITIETVTAQIKEYLAQ